MSPFDYKYEVMLSFFIRKGAQKDLKNMKFLGIIPARYASTRFPAKPLAMLGVRQ